MVSGASFSRLHKMLAFSGVVWLVVLAIDARPQANHLLWPEIYAMLFFVAVLAVGLLYILTATTTVDDQFIEERWLFTKRIHVNEIVKCKLIDLPWLRWFIAPRIVIQTGGFSTYTFRTSDPDVLAELREILYRHSAR